MTVNHDNPTEPRVYQKKKDGRPTGPRYELWARAPYNFVPLPDRMVPARLPLSHDRYHQEAVTGVIHCTLETKSPVYVRGMLSRQAFREQGRKKPKQLTPQEKENHVAFFGYGGEMVEGQPVPVIPGSSLRGMIRQLVEIIAHGRMRWVADRPTFTFRAVAAQSNDPLARPYEQVMGRYGRNVQAGYLEKEGEVWYVQPAKTPKQVGWNRNKWDKWVKIVDEDVTLKGFLHFDDADYKPQIRQISFKHGPRVPKKVHKKGKPDRPSISVAKPGVHKFEGVLVTSGSMSETGGTSPRRNHAIVLPRDTNRRRLLVPERAIEAYRKGLTPFQEEDLDAWAGGDWGVVAEDRPVFFVEEGGEVAYFGHSPNFRVPARPAGQKEAATPRDFVPDELWDDPQPDLADAIFGWIEEEGSPSPQWHDQEALKSYAGRVFFEDASFVDADDDVWYSDEPIIPQVLASPKPTTFQHYLAQNRRAGHNPDNKSSLAHYGTSPKETQIRGYKLYWHKGKKPDIEAEPEKGEEGGWKHESQYTRIRPLNPGVRFAFDIHFENLRPEELGALLWALALPVDDASSFSHKLGMGKPLGMGGVVINPTLHLSNRTGDRQPGRYEKLFEDDQWYRPGEQEVGLEFYLDVFTSYVLESLNGDESEFSELDRIRMLLEMLRWREGDKAWLEKTRYMEIEYGDDEINEYVERPVLPDPLRVVGKKTTSPQGKRTVSQPRRIADLQSGSVLPGTVTRTVNYGAFVDVGVESDGLIHISELKDGWVDKVENVVQQGQVVRVKVLSTDPHRKRIELSMKNVAQSA